MIEQLRGLLGVGHQLPPLLPVALGRQRGAALQPRPDAHPLPHQSAGEFGGGGVLDAAFADDDAAPRKPRREHVQRQRNAVLHFG